MLTEQLIDRIKKDDTYFYKLNKDYFCLPAYDSRTHYLELTKSHYFKALIFLRHYVKVVSDYYFDVIQGAKNVDLFMLTPSISRQWDLVLTLKVYR